MSNSFSIASLPLYWRVKSQSDPKHKFIPETFDISVSLNSENNAITQILNDNVKSNLLKIYSENENIGYLRDDNKLAIGYHNDLLRFLNLFLTSNKVDNILEIGCGGCTILEQLQLNGYNVTGLDPSPFARNCSEKKNIKLIEEFFRPELIQEDYEMVFFSDVLEHVFEPIVFLKQLNESLKKGSSIIIAVPDATVEAKTGDYSMLMHQHVSYFTEVSLKNTILKAGLTPINIEKAKYGGSLYAIATVTNNTQAEYLFNESYSSKYFSLAATTKQNFSKLFSEVQTDYSNILCYVPLRAIPYLASIQKLNIDNLYFIDDTPFWENSIIDGTNYPIMPLYKAPKSNADCIFIFSNTFGDKIKQKVFSHYQDLSLFPRVVTISDFSEGLCR